MKALSLFANVRIAEAFLRTMCVDVKTAVQSGDWLNFREVKTSHLESCGYKYYIKENLRKASSGRR